MAKGTGQPIRIGIGGWIYAPWRDNFYPKGLRQADELAFAASRVTSIEINATFYRTQAAKSFQAWRATVPEGFVFSVKAARAASQRSDPDAAAPAIERFLQSGLTELGPALGPILWQLPAGRKFDADVMQRFLALLPRQLDGLALRHVLEARHESFASAASLELLREHNVALAVIDRDAIPINPFEAPLTADFVYLRLQRTQDQEPLGYAPADLDAWAQHLHQLAAARPVFAYVISGAKHRAPAAAGALIERCSKLGASAVPIAAASCTKAN